MDSGLFAVATHPDDWLSDDQKEAIQRALGGWATPARSDDAARFFAWAERTARDTALLGLVVAHQSGRSGNRHYWGEFGPAAKNNAGWPNALWLPPRTLGDLARSILGDRLERDGDVQRALDWAEWQIAAWWRLAPIFHPDYRLDSINERGQPVSRLAEPPLPAAVTSTGDLVHLDDREAPISCVAVWPVYALSERVQAVHSHRCVLPPAPTSLLCTVHEALGIL